MNNKGAVSKAFNKGFFDFLEDIKDVFPENKDIDYAIRTFDNIKKLNTTAIIKVWYSNVYLTHKEIIDNIVKDKKQIDFFIEKDYSSELDGVSKSGEILKMIDNIRSPIRQMSEGSKHACAQHIFRLSKLSEMYNQL